MRGPSSVTPCQRVSALLDQEEREVEEHGHPDREHCDHEDVRLERQVGAGDYLATKATAACEFGERRDRNG